LDLRKKPKVKNLLRLSLLKKGHQKSRFGCPFTAYVHVPIGDYLVLSSEPGSDRAAGGEKE
jgi:hypothetical protein